MIIRAMEDKDILEVTRIYNKFYKNEFDIGNFNHLIERAFIIEKHNKIVCAGGIKALAECVLITDKDVNDFTKIKALRSSLNIFGYIARQHNFDSIHAFVEDNTWKEHLVNNGFRTCKGTAIVLEV